MVWLVLFLTLIGMLTNPFGALILICGTLARWHTGTLAHWHTGTGGSWQQDSPGTFVDDLSDRLRSGLPDSPGGLQSLTDQAGSRRRGTCPGGQRGQQFLPSSRTPVVADAGDDDDPAGGCFRSLSGPVVPPGAGSAATGGQGFGVLYLRKTSPSRPLIRKHTHEPVTTGISRNPSAKS